MRIIYLFIFLSILFNPLAAKPLQGEDMSCAEMHQIVQQMDKHMCCDGENDMQSTSMSPKLHDCDNCSDCKSHCTANCCLFSLRSFSEPIAKQAAYLGIELSNYPTPLQVNIRPPIA